MPYALTILYIICTMQATTHLGPHYLLTVVHRCLRCARETPWPRPVHRDVRHSITRGARHAGASGRGVCGPKRPCSHGGAGGGEGEGEGEGGGEGEVEGVCEGMCEGEGDGEGEGQGEGEGEGEGEDEGESGKARV